MGSSRIPLSGRFARPLTLEQLQIGELVVKGSDVGVVRKLTRTDGTLAHLVQVFSLSENGQFPGLEGGI